MSTQPFAQPLVSALGKLIFSLENEKTPRVIVATRYEEELKQQTLPAHVRVTSRPLRGKRVAYRGPQNFRSSRLKVAEWPEDRLDESALMSLIIVVNGQADIVAGDYVLHCRPGDFVLLPPGVPKGNYLSCILDGNPKRTCDIFRIYPGRLWGQGLECWISHSRGEKVENGLQQGAALIKNHALAQLFAQLCDEIQSHSKNAIVHHLLLSFILLLHRELETGRSFMPESKRLELPMSQTADFAADAKAYIDSHLDSHITIDIMARQFAMSPTTFKQHFREKAGVTFHEYLTTRRAEFAATLLATTDMKVEGVANIVGLKYTQFRKLFHVRYGCSPSNYRKTTQ